VVGPFPAPSAGVHQGALPRSRPARRGATRRRPKVYGIRRWILPGARVLGLLRFSCVDAGAGSDHVVSYSRLAPPVAVRGHLDRSASRSHLSRKRTSKRRKTQKTAGSGRPDALPARGRGSRTGQRETPVSTRTCNPAGQCLSRGNRRNRRTGRRRIALGDHRGAKKGKRSGVAWWQHSRRPQQPIPT